MTFIAPLIVLIAINLLTVLTFAHDKARAASGGWRVRESTLLSLAFIGGSPGALWARRRFRHKTRKQPFATYLDLIAMVHAGVLIGLATLAIW
ncbi:DUF1294 domain-containing protein [Sphingomonas sp. Leaf37]|uniref:DUF1294 domain-containing protein n=1 Tax=Sphingomonas sp. Leaf37 TaxID=2876552 RepID=UPI001E4173E3|nr:DUF1294 domain-containing protein [Sphingomonas sp. Leaf37]